MGVNLQGAIRVILLVLIAFSEIACGFLLQHPSAEVTASSHSATGFEPHRIAIAQALSSEMQDLLGNSVSYALAEQLRQCGVSSALGMSAHEVINGRQRSIQTEYDQAALRQLSPDSTLLLVEKSRVKKVVYGDLVNVMFNARLIENSTRNVIWSGGVSFAPVGQFTERPIAGGPTIAQAIVTSLRAAGYLHGCPRYLEVQPLETVRVPRTSFR